MTLPPTNRALSRSPTVKCFMTDQSSLTELWQDKPGHSPSVTSRIDTSSYKIFSPFPCVGEMSLKESEIDILNGNKVVMPFERWQKNHGSYFNQMIEFLNNF